VARALSAGAPTCSLPLLLALAPEALRPGLLGPAMLGAEGLNALFGRFEQKRRQQNTSPIYGTRRLV
jgi:hypothetical protein